MKEEIEFNYKQMRNKMNKELKNNNDLIIVNDVDKIYNDIKILVEENRNRVYKTVNTEMINLYWNIDKMLVEMQDGNKKVKYGEYLIKELSKKLTDRYRKVYSITNLKSMRKFYSIFPIGLIIWN